MEIARLRIRLARTIVVLGSILLMTGSGYVFGKGLINLEKVQPEDILNWNHLLPLERSFISAGHGHQRVRIYFNEVARSVFTGQCPLPFPPGAVIAKAFVADDQQATLQARKIFFMHKRTAGYDAENSDWEYGAAFRTGDTYRMTHHGIIQSCIPCHKAYADWDYVVSIDRFRDYQGYWGYLKALVRWDL